MLEKLTAEQEASLPRYYQKWLDIGLSTTDELPTEEGLRPLINAVYEVADLTPPEEIVIVESPLAGANYVSKFSKNSLQDYGYGTHDAYWLGFYEFFKDECHLSCCETLTPLINFSQRVGWWWPFEKLCVISAKPTFVKTNDNGLHCETGHAIEYLDGWGVYALNGVRVPEWVVMKPEAKRIMELRNADVRRELVRLIGMERLWFELNPTIIDEEEFPIGGKYTLADIQVGDSNNWRVLKMENPSVPEVWHVEGVTPQCSTVREALNFRNGLTEDQIDDENGLSWYQQGDVILRPQGKKFKRFPEVIT